MRSQLRPTRSGWGVLLAASILIVAGSRTGWSELAWLGVLGVTAVVVGAVLVAVLAPLAAARHTVMPGRVVVDNPALCQVRFTHAPPNLTPVEVSETLDGVASVVPPGTTDDPVAIALPTNRRGVFEVGPLVCVRGDPFGLVVSRRALDSAVELVVHPRTWPLLRDPSSSLHDMDGPTIEEQVAGSDTFHRLREYEPGDEPRLIHWPASAHAGQLVVRHFVDTARPEVVVILDDLADSYGGSDELDLAVEVAASIVVSASAAGAPVRLWAFGGEDVQVPTGEPTTAIMDGLARLELQATTHESLARLGVELDGTACVLVTGHGSHGVGACRAVVEELQAVTGRLVVLTVGGADPPAMPPGVLVVSAPTPAAVLERWSAL